MSQKNYGVAFWILVMLIITLTSIGFVIAYSTYGKPAQFGNATTITCEIGGDFGSLNCTANRTHAYCNECWESEDIYDVDKADIETDLNTFVDVAGDEMVGNLTLNNSWLKIGGTDGSNASIYWNGTALIISVP